MRKLLKSFLEKLVAWMQRKMYEDTISEKESEKMWREFKKFLEENRVK
jgi:CRISPR/Cas system-associated endoribonuclease Cas2